MNIFVLLTFMTLHDAVHFAFILQKRERFKLYLIVYANRQIFLEDIWQYFLHKNGF